MSRLIDADALFKAFEKAAWYNNANRDEIAEELLSQMPTIEQTTWISVDEKLPEFYINQDGCYCTHGKIVFRSEWDKTVHLGYCIKLIYIINTDTLETIETIEWYDDHGNKWENVSHWALLPKEEHIEDKA